MNRIKNMLRRGLVCLLALVILIASMPSVPYLALANAPVSISITKDGTPITDLTIHETDKVMLHAQAENADGMTCRWQILDVNDSSRWINIHDAVYETLSVSYALLGSMLNNQKQAQLRCTAWDGDTMYASEPVTVTVSRSRAYSVTRSASNTTTAEPFAPMTASEEDLGTYSIVINYIFDDGSIAFEPYGASVAKGSNFSASIPSPSVVGYQPVLRTGEDYVDATVVELDYADIQQNITVNVIYEPALVNFSVHHHLQNLLDDDYSIHYDLITTSQALTGSLVPEGLALTEGALPGFKALAYERLTVAADGSTVVEIRYDRNYYLVDFDNNGGYGVDPIYTRYGTVIGANIPVRHGYVFDGWELVTYNGQAATTEQKAQYAISDTTTITLPAANLCYRARWITQQTTYTMVFWKENANDNGYSYCGYLDGLTAMSGSYVSGEPRLSEVPGVTDEAYFTFNEARTEKNVLVEGDGSTVVNVYYTRNHYSITFKATGLCTIPENHTHSDSCYDSICGFTHTHTDACRPTLTCTTAEHTAHTESCLTCTVPAHTHGTAGCNCTLTEHTHTVSCWKNIGTAGTPSGAPSGVADGYIYRRSFSSYIYIKGTWYRYTTWGASSGDVVSPACGSTEHTHGTDCACDLQAHTHGDSCYADVLHTHNENCYRYSCGTPAHTHTAACQRLICGDVVGHSHSSTCRNSNSTNTVKTVYRKYQQSLEDLWPVTDDHGVCYDDGQRWSPSGSSYYSAVLVYLSKMVPDDFTLTLSESTADPYTMNYYLQVLPGETYTHTYSGNNYILDHSIKAKYNYVTKAEDFFDITGFHQYASDPDFSSNNQIQISGSDKTVDFYYNRIADLTLEFSSVGEVLESKTVTNIMYGAPLHTYNFQPDYPDNLEPNAYAFGGWYTSPGCFDGTEVDWDSLTMPEEGLLLYAKWAPVRHTVKVYQDATLTQQLGQTQLVDHNAFAHAPEGTVQNGNYIFQGWFYMDTVDGKQVEKAFAFHGIPITQDMNIYAKWSSHVSVDYAIHYVLNETGEPIADSTYGSAIAGHNKTFDAKAGNDLYTPYRSGFFPLTNSHTITMSVDGTHEFTFRYVYREAMPYTVRYVDSATGETVYSEKKVADNTLSVVTEAFVKVDKMMPDAYQKRLVLSADGQDADNDGVLDNNVITFYYHADEVHAYYHVVHYIQSISGYEYREYRSEEMVGTIGTSYAVEALSLTGFTFNGGNTVVNGVSTPITGSTVTHTLGPEGAKIELYYDRNMVSYTVKYTNNDTGKPLFDDKVGSSLYGAQVLEYAPDLSDKGYHLVSDDLKMLALSANESHNVIEFLYQEAFVSVKYEAVGPVGCGTLSQYAENVKAISGKPAGSQPTASEGFLFDGWYTDPACTVAVSADVVNAKTGYLTPVKETEIWSDGMTYYAKFLAEETDLTIQVTGTAQSDAQQAYLFRVTGTADTDTAGIDLTVSVIGDHAVTITGLPVGQYTVTEQLGWSWRYENTEATQTITLTYVSADNLLTYDNSRENGKWLDGNAVANNLFDQ